MRRTLIYGLLTVLVAAGGTIVTEGDAEAKTTTLPLVCSGSRKACVKKAQRTADRFCKDNPRVGRLKIETTYTTSTGFKELELRGTCKS
jgi:hypothetical protein